MTRATDSGVAASNRLSYDRAIAPSTAATIVRYGPDGSAPLPSDSAAAAPKPVRIRPGSTIVTSIPNGRTSWRNASEIASTAYLLAW